MRGTSKVCLQPHQILRLPLQSTTPVLLCTISTTPVLQRTTPVLLCTRKYYNVLPSTATYYSSTTPNYKKRFKVLRQYYNVLPSTTTYYSGTTLKRHLQCAEQVKSPSNLTKYCACHEILKLKISAKTP